MPKYRVKETLNSARQINPGSLPILNLCQLDARMPAGNVPARGRQTLPDPVPAPLIAPEEDSVATAMVDQPWVMEEGNRASSCASGYLIPK